MWCSLLLFSWDNLGNLLFLMGFLIRGFVNGSELGGGVCFTLVVDVDYVVGFVPLKSFTTSSILRAGAAGWLMTPGDVS